MRSGVVCLFLCIACEVCGHYSRERCPRLHTYLKARCAVEYFRRAHPLCTIYRWLRSQAGWATTPPPPIYVYMGHTLNLQVEDHKAALTTATVTVGLTQPLRYLVIGQGMQRAYPPVNLQLQKTIKPRRWSRNDQAKNTTTPTVTRGALVYVQHIKTSKSYTNFLPHRILEVTQHRTASTNIQPIPT